MKSLFKFNDSFNSAIWYTVSNIISKGIIVALTPIFARVLSKAQMGEYTNFVSWQNILVIVFTFEIGSAILRAKFDFSNDEFSSFTFNVILFDVCFPLIFVGIIILFFREKLQTILSMDLYTTIMLYVVIFCYPMLQIFQSQQRACVKYKASSIVTVLFGFLSLVFPLFFLLIFTNRIYAITTGIAVNYLVWAVAIFIYYLNTTRCKKISFQYIRYALFIALPLVPHLVSNVIMGNSDKVMIRQMCGSEFAALYGVVYTSALIVTLLRNSLNTAWIPWFYQKMSENNLAAIKNISNLFILFFSLATILVCLLGREIVFVLGGRDYLDATSLVPIIMLGCYYNFINLFYVNIEFYEKKTGIISVITVVTAILNVFMNYYFIGIYGYQAAAYTTAFCNGLIVLLHYLVTKNMRNSEICNNKLILLSCLSSVLFVASCAYIYVHILLRIVLIVLTCLVLIFEVVKNSHLIKG